MKQYWLRTVKGSYVHTIIDTNYRPGINAYLNLYQRREDGDMVKHWSGHTIQLMFLPFKNSDWKVVKEFTIP